MNVGADMYSLKFTKITENDTVKQNLGKKRKLK